MTRASAVRAGAVALVVLLASPGCSAEAGGAADATEQDPAGALPARADRPVLDQADLLPAAEEAALDQRLRRLWTDTGDALVVVTVDSLQGRTIEDYATELFNEWGIGDSETDRGLLLLVAPNERTVRIEVGCGLESTITNEVAKSIIDRSLVPAYRQGDFVGGIEAGVEALTARLALPKPANDPGPHSELCRKAA